MTEVHNSEVSTVVRNFILMAACFAASCVWNYLFSQFV